MRVFVLAGLVLAWSLSACTPATPPVTNADRVPRRPGLNPAVQQVTFEGLQGTVQATDTDGAVALVVSVTDLNPQQVYEVGVGRDDGATALFDVHNTQLTAGLATGETTFVPDATGQLVLHSTHPARIVAGGRVVVYAAGPAFTTIGRSAVLTTP